MSSRKQVELHQYMELTHISCFIALVLPTATIFQPTLSVGGGRQPRSSKSVGGGNGEAAGETKTTTNRDEQHNLTLNFDSPWVYMDAVGIAAKWIGLNRLGSCPTTSDSVGGVTTTTTW